MAKAAAAWLLLCGLTVSSTARADARDVRVPEELAPLRAKLEKTRTTLMVDCWIAPIADLGRDNPCHLAGDFDGDGRQDLALMVREKSGKQRKGIAVITAKGAIAIAGAGTRAGAGGDDFVWMDAWRVEPKAGPNAKADAIVVEKTESASGLLAWKSGRLVWRQLGD